MKNVNETLKELNLYLRYVDDEYIICEVIPENEENQGPKDDGGSVKMPLSKESHTEVKFYKSWPDKARKIKGLAENHIEHNCLSVWLLTPS